MDGLTSYVLAGYKGAVVMDDINPRDVDDMLSDALYYENNSYSYGC